MTTQQQHIDEIKRLVTATGFAAKDFFLTQPPAPDRKDKAAYATWCARERRRRSIARRMYRHGLTAHDLISKPNITSPRGWCLDHSYSARS
jgi:hypothetical protein